MAQADLPPFVRLDGDAVTLVLALAGRVPAVVYWGPSLDAATDSADVALLAERAEANGSPATEAPLALTPLGGQGWPGRPGLAAHRDGRDWATYALVERIAAEPRRVVIHSLDAAHGVRLTHELRIAGDVLVATTTLTNTGEAPLDVAHLVAPALPLPQFVRHLTGFEGRWAGEFQTVEFERHVGSWVRENRRGRTSHDAFPGLIASADGVTAQAGLTYAFHLGWSGNHRLAVETLSDGRASVTFEDLLLPGEVRLAPGATLATPAVYATVSSHGRNGVAQAFHRYLRARPEHARLRARPRPVHYNSWEAVYFDHDPAVLAELAIRAAAVGVERFVLDDGWFKGRRNDRAGLGDWAVDADVYPNGLGPLIDHVQGLGMEFGLWVEPEMVNPESDLYRAHPDWAMATPPAQEVGFRHQLVLDFGRAEVRDHLHARIDALLSDHPIRYLKWDMNRDLSQPGGADGRAAAHAHVLGLYEVLDRLRADHPDVEIESCASGGGRADYGVLARTDRVWTSDSNDALDRLSIQRGFARFFPAELMGSHVGPATCHITGRRLPMSLRVATALFGHMGMELDLRALDPAATAELTAGVALHKKHRGLIHSGDRVQLDTADGVEAFLIVAPDRSEALLSYTMISEQRGYFPETLRLAGLDRARRYALELVWPVPSPVRWPLIQAGAAVSGDALMQAGFQPPRSHPGTALIVHLTGKEPDRP